MDWLLLCMEKFELIRYNEKKTEGISALAE